MKNPLENIKQKIRNRLRFLDDRQKISLCLSKAAIGCQLRKIDDNDPTTWEFSGFSQNGEDGIIEFLTSKILKPNKYFIEIGSSDGIQCNTAFLAFVKYYNGLMIEGDIISYNRCRYAMPQFNLGVETINLFVDRENISELLKSSISTSPDVFSLDIDGNDYYLAEIILKNGYRPKIIVVEYNSAFGPDAEITIEYDKDFSIYLGHPTHLYYGVSVAGWRKFFSLYNYEFITVDTNGVNAFFIRKEDFDEQEFSKLQGSSFAENFYQMRKFKQGWKFQFGLIDHLPYKSI